MLKYLITFLIAVPTLTYAESDFMTITENRVLRTLESKGLSIGEMLSPNKDINQIVANVTLYNQTPFKRVVDDIQKHLEQIQKNDPGSDVGMKVNHRLFDIDFLRSKYSRFSLVGVVLRMDKAFMDPATCGEVRLLYRLSYNVKSRGEDVASRLPMSLNLVFNARRAQMEPETDCAHVAQRWQIPEQFNQSLAKLSEGQRVGTLVNYIRENVLNSTVISFENLKQMEINLQSMRWPSGIKASLAGHAEYLLKIYQWNKNLGEFEDQYLENQIDLEQLKPGSELKKDLLAWIKNPKNLEAIDKGIMILPERFLTKHAISVSAGGARRIQNRPFYRTFTSKDFAGMDYADLERIKSPSALLRRLDDHTCNGCHQQKSIAGFHFIGKDPEQKYPLNSSLVPGSPHFLGDQPRRRKIVEAFLNHQEPDFSRGFAERADSTASVAKLKGTGMIDGWGARCSLGTDPSYSKWTCADGFECRAVYKGSIESGLGVCFAKGEAQVGDYCESSSITVNPEALYSRADTGSPVVALAVKNKDYRCATASGGFPGGSIWKWDCDNLPSHAACALLPTKKPGFNACLGSGKNYPNCIKEFSSPVGLRRCDEMNPCRDDYLCIQAEKPTEGVCIPPYFLFQFRVDGHPLERSSQ